MSIWSKLKGAVVGGIGGFVTGGPAGAAAGAVGGYMSTTKAPKQRGVMASYPSVLPGGSRLGSPQNLGRIAKIGGSVMSRAGGYVGAAGTAMVAGSMLYDAFGNPVRRKRRRMNPMNGKAARRAIRRIKAVRKITMDIERSLPKQRQARSNSRSRSNNPDFIQLRNS